MRISTTVLADMVAHAREEAPRECCGLLVGRGDVIDRNVRARNMDDRPTRRYLIDPVDHFAAIRIARAEGKHVLGAYHSHPASDPVPSPTDIAEANGGSEFVYIIVSPTHAEVRAYRYESESVAPSPLPLTPI